MFPELVSMKIWRRRVFDVIDRHWGYAYEPNSKVRQRNFDLAAETARVSDKVVCVSEGLVTELSGNVAPQLLPNAIDLERVKRSAVNGPGVRSNTAVYAGGWNERLDHELLAELVRRNPEWQFAFVGADPDERFSHFSNVKFFGDVPYDTVLRELSQARIGLIPFVSNSFTESSNFLKILDYLASGVTIGATDLASLREWNERYPDTFKILENLEEWDELFSCAGDADLRTSDLLEGGDMIRYGTMTRALSLVSTA
ncbi:glycosyltransferase family 1 protein [Arthrobacter sp. SPG23]|uniref:glycosyltransferase family 1 protein n=1 Tax=Arthrobacter sp. SPG23 TaxID=1610703 RepID=UPI001186603D|nr:glycosyltransferase family 1 protein [Arthrobacter sp. SPG23]